MKKMEIYEPAMCCSTGICGVSVDPELLRISAVLDKLRKNGCKIRRYNLSGSPIKFIDNETVNNFIQVKGAEGLPIVLVDGEIVLEGRYPSNEEFEELLELPKGFVSASLQAEKISEEEAPNSGC